MNVLFWANKNVFSWPVSSNVKSGPRSSYGTDSSNGICDITGAGWVVVGSSVINGSLLVVCKYGGSVSVPNNNQKQKKNY